MTRSRRGAGSTLEPDEAEKEVERLVAEVQTGMRGYSEGDLRAVAGYLADAAAARVLALEAEIARLRAVLQQQTETRMTRTEFLLARIKGWRP